MATQHTLLSKLSTELRHHDNQLDKGLRSSVGVSVRVFKIIRSLTQLAGVLLGFYAMSLGADPLTAFGIALAFYVGPEGAEKVIMARSDG